MTELRTMQHVKGMHDVRHHQSIRHSTARGTVFQQLERLAQEKERVLTRARLWMSNLKREEELIGDIDRQREALLGTLEPFLREELEGNPTNPSASSPGREETLEY